jgi:tetratricopeptide (TPR) repeat protein
MSERLDAVNTPLAQQLALSTFTPSTMPQATLEGMFVQREQLLQSIVEDLAASIDGAKQYLMLVGARGMGKTHFVSLVYHRLKQQPELHDRLLIAWLREEEYGVNSWLYLIIEILRSLSQEGIDTEEQINKLASLPISEAEYLANRVLTEVIGDRTLLIITENIDKLLYGLGDKEQWKFRAFLQETNCCSILSTTPKISQDTSKKEKPFFNFFTSIHLPNFTHADAVAMLIKIANLSGNTQLAKFLDTDEGKSRVRALHHLAGGNPRVYALFAQLITEDTLEALLPAVIEMLDKLTPYYQSRVESLGQSDDQQKIVMYLARETRAVTVKEITAQCFISSENTTSNALKQLMQKGFLISTKKGREVYYEISEVLMRLCLEMKNAKNGDLKLCVDFIRIWFRPNERQEYLERLELDGKLEHAKYFWISLINAKFDPIILACKRDLQQSIDSGDIKNAMQVWRELVCLNQIGETENQRIVEMINGGKSYEAIVAIEIILKGKTVEELYLKGSLLIESEQWEEALELFKIVLDLQPEKHEYWCKHGRVLDNLGRYEEAIASYDKALEINSDDYKIWGLRGYSLGNLNKYGEEVRSYDRVLEIAPGNKQTLVNRSIALYFMSRYDEAISDLDSAIEIESEHKVWILRGLILNESGRYEDAIVSYDRSLELKPDDDTRQNRKIALNNLVENLHNKGLANFKQEKYSEALLLWQKTFNIIQKEQLGDASDQIQEFLDEQLLPKFQQPAVRDILPQILTIYTTAQVLPELGVALTRNLKAIQAHTISDYTAAEWLKMWQELGKPHPELALALRMVEVGIKYKQNPTDDRVFLSLPQEMRPLLREALGLEP